MSVKKRKKSAARHHEVVDDEPTYTAAAEDEPEPEPEPEPESATPTQEEEVQQEHEPKDYVAPDDDPPAADAEPPPAEPSILERMGEYYAALPADGRAEMVKANAAQYAEEHGATLDCWHELGDLMTLAGIPASAENIGSVAYDMGWTGNPGDRDAIRQNVLPGVLARLGIA